jgi:hypothetical protein
MKSLTASILRRLALILTILGLAVEAPLQQDLGANLSISLVPSRKDLAVYIAQSSLKKVWSAKLGHYDAGIEFKLTCLLCPSHTPKQWPCMIQLPGRFHSHLF